MHIQTKTLKNNIVIISEPIENLRTVSIGFWFPIGSRDEPTGSRGITHFVEHMLFKGTKQHNAYELACIFDSLGGYINAFTDRECLCLYCVVPAQYAQNAFDTMLAMIHHSTFPNAEFEKERKVIESEIISSDDDPEEVAFDILYETIWKNQQIAQSISGTCSDIRALRYEAVLSWYELYIQKGKLSVCVAGDLDNFSPEATLQNLPQHESFAMPIQKSGTLCWQSGTFFSVANFQQEQFFLAFPMKFPLSQPEYYAWAILNAIIGDTMSSRLFQHLRETHGYCYNVFSFVNTFRDAAFFCAYASSAKKNTQKVLEQMSKQIECFFQNGVSSAEIHAAKQHILGEAIIAAEDVESRMKRLAKHFFLGYPQSDLSTTDDFLNSLSDNEINQILFSSVECKNQTTLIYGPKCKFSIP